MHRRTDAAVAVLAGIAAFLLQSFVVRTYGANVPYWDEWDDLVGFVHKLRLGAAHWGDWFAPHMEHRIFVPRIFFGLVKLIFGDANIIACLLISACLAGLIACTWAYVLRRLDQPVWLIAASIPIIGTIGQYENILWGFQIQFYTLLLPMLIGIAVAALATRITWPLVLFIAFACSVSTFSMASGVLSWGVLSAVLIMRWLLFSPESPDVQPQFWLRFVVFITVGVINMACYFVHFVHSAGPPGNASGSWVLPRWAAYAFVFPILNWENTACDKWLPLAIAGLATPIVLGCISYFRHREHSRLMLVSGLLFMVLSNLAVTAYGRGHQTWVASRYGTVFVWTSAVALFTVADLERRSRKSPRAALRRAGCFLLGAGIVGAQLAAYPRFVPVMKDFHRNRLAYAENVLNYLTNLSPNRQLPDFVPFPKDRLKAMLDDPTFVRALPAGFRSTPLRFEGIGDGWSVNGVPPLLKQFPGHLVWGSLGGNIGSPRIVTSEPFQAKKGLTLFVAGSPAGQGDLLAIESADSPRERVIFPGPNPGPRWVAWRIARQQMPPGPVRIVAVHGGTSGWLGLAIPQQESTADSLLRLFFEHLTAVAVIMTILAAGSTAFVTRSRGAFS